MNAEEKQQKIENWNAGALPWHCQDCGKPAANVVDVTEEEYQVREVIWKVNAQGVEYPKAVERWESCDYLHFECQDCGYTWEEWDDGYY